MKLFRRPSSAPLWQDEFSVYTANERYVNRRQFTKFLTLTSLGMFAGNLWILLRSLFSRAPSYPILQIGPLDEVPVHGVKTFAYPTPNDPCILVRTGSASWVAYSQKCTHLSCAVYYERENHRLACPCHQGFFSARDGSVLQGPPQRALPRILVESKDGHLFAVRVEGNES
jgi:nitrite reductase/ring-hydroxylating ferredoxin subunit